MGVEFRSPIPADPADLERRLRPQDRRELEALHGEGSALGVIEHAIRSSVDAKAFLKDGQLLALFGVATRGMMGSTGIPWMLGAVGLEKNSRVLVSAGRAYIEDIRGLFPNLVNMVDARNTTAIRWLKALGFEVEAPIPYGRKGEPFCRFTMGAPDV